MSNEFKRLLELAGLLIVFAIAFMFVLGAISLADEVIDQILMNIYQRSHWK